MNDNLHGSLDAAVVLYRFFCTFPGFGEVCPLGFEGQAGKCGAVFSMEPLRNSRRRYINGGEMYTAACTISRCVQDMDGAHRLRLTEWFSSLSAYAEVYGKALSGDGGGLIERVRPASVPARLRMTADGAVWEMRFFAEIRI
ncbi:MAG: hypothetical protein J6S76_06010 [Clostridia bacterium]|nr:hypothetical protein [Clostridia bacterium]